MKKNKLAHDLREQSTAVWITKQKREDQERRIKLETAVRDTIAEITEKAKELADKGYNQVRHRLESEWFYHTDFMTAINKWAVEEDFRSIETEEDNDSEQYSILLTW